AFLMVFVILWGILDVIWVLYNKLSTPPYFLLNINDILATFGAFMAVLIAIEILENIVMYLERDIINLRLVLDTDVMAAARKDIGARRGPGLSGGVIPLCRKRPHAEKAALKGGAPGPIGFVISVMPGKCPARAGEHRRNVLQAVESILFERIKRKRARRKAGSAHLGVV
ncbi:phosphate-starvation-inducible PsiE family protein, partial [Oceanidesulfovibrio indonesiensis]|uniref:phosphate-starvation-inducible PsiE family protein n=1 Tax=Oceanidesulfovibrio indonesiensis TaxID=54767 RepID=UPI001F1BA220